MDFSNPTGGITKSWEVASRKGCVDFSTPGDMLCEMGDIVASRKGCVDFSANSSVLGNTLVVASRKGCVDFSIKQESVNVSIKGSHLARDAWILAYMFFRSIRKESSHPARDAWILA